MEIESLLKKGVVVQSHHEPGEYISPIFVTGKSDGGYRLILNLKKLNKLAEYKKFKMETISTILCLIRPNCFMAKVDIKDAYYSIPILEEHQKFLKFLHKSVLYKFTALPNGYTEGPRKFTKALKPPLSNIRKQGVTVAGYFDDLMTLAITEGICIQNISKIISVFDSLGFVIHPEKSTFLPSQQIEFLGFVINSVTMTVSLTVSKKEAIKEMCSLALSMELSTIRFIAKILGKFSSSFIAVPLGKLHYRKLERHKSQALKLNRGNFDKKIALTKECKSDILWWERNILSSESPIIRENPSLIIHTDASLFGWGASMPTVSTGGQFSLEEQQLHINILELKAALFGLQSLCNNTRNCHILIKIDNTSAVTSINKMGSIKSIEMDSVVHDIWNWIISKNNWITATHIPGILNTEADKESRMQETRTEWMLCKNDFHKIIQELSFNPKIDLFASRLNNQLPAFVSYRPDPLAMAINAFTLDWGETPFYAFPPFSIIPRVLQKIFHDKASGILVVPDWPNQPWFSQCMHMSDTKIFLFPRNDLLTLPQSNELHPLRKSLALLAVLILSG